MRGGYFLAEDNPKQLMKAMGMKSLETIYLNLSVEQSRGRGNPITTDVGQVKDSF